MHSLFTLHIAEPLRLYKSKWKGSDHLAKSEMCKRVISALMISIIVPALVQTVYAVDSVTVSTPDNAQAVPVTLTAEPLQFSVTLPRSLPIAVDSTGKVHTADNAEI